MHSHMVNGYGMTNRIHCKVLVFLCFVTTTMLFLLWNRTAVYFPKRPAEFAPPPEDTYLMRYTNNYWRPEKVKKILMYTRIFRERVVDHDIPKSMKKCRAMRGKCEVTSNRTKLSESDAIIFHANDYWELNDTEIPQYRHPRQVWVFFSMEANPSMTGHLPSHTFNWTMGYRRDSTILIPYGGPYIKKTLHEIKRDGTTTIDYFSEKTKFAVIQVSNCHDNANRFPILEEIAKYIELDNFGKCSGNIICPLGNVTLEECTDRLKHYKFYLAIENSHCRDYVTEKYWQSQLNRHQIPVVAYSNKTLELIPPHSYINIFDFPSLKAVAAKMIEVGNNKTLYNSYFEWQNYHKDVRRDPYCIICEYLHANRTAQSVDLQAWMKHDSCFLPPCQYTADKFSRCL